MNQPMIQRYFQRALKKRHPFKPPKRLPRQLHPERVEAQYERTLLEILSDAKAKIDARIKPMLSGLVQYYGRERKDADDLGDLADELNKVRIEMEQDYTDEEVRRLAKLTGTSIEDWNKLQMSGQLRGIVEIDLFGHEPWLAREMGAFITQNVSLISSIDDEYLSQVEKVVATSVRSGLRAEEIAAELDERYDVGISRARMIARDQVGKFNGQLTELRQKDLGIEGYIRRGVGDARERESHFVLNDKPFTWDDPPDVGHPGEDFQCRCWAEPDLSQFYDDSDAA